MNKISSYKPASISYIERNKKTEYKRLITNIPVSNQPVSFGAGNVLFQIFHNLMRHSRGMQKTAINKGSKFNITVYAAEYLNKVVENSTKLIKKGTATSDTYITKARALAGMEKFEEAGENIAKVLATETNPVKIKVCENLQQTIAEIEAINQKIKANPLEMKTLILERARLYRTISKEKALVDYHWASVFWEFEERSVTRSQKLAEIFSKMGDINMEQDTPDIESAISCYRKVIKLNPNDVRAQKTFQWLKNLLEM